jgi:HSP20 family protein
MLPVAIRRRRGWDDPTSPMERLFRLYRNWELPSDAEGELTGAYPVDIREEDGKLVVDAEMPGFRREEVDVNIDKGVLTITAERKPAEVKGTRHLTERCYTRVERSFTLPDPVDESKVNAKLDDGVLHLELPQTEESKPRRIEVK